MLHHQMHVQGHAGQAFQRADHGCTKGKVGDEVPVHHVDVEPVRTAGNGPLDLLAQAAEIGAEDTRRDSHVAHRPLSGPRLTTRLMAAPRGRPTPAAGRVARMTPRSFPPGKVSIDPTRTPAAAMILAA